MSCVHAEPDEIVHCWRRTDYCCETDSDAVSYNVTLKSQKFVFSEFFNFESKTLKGLRLTFTTELPGSSPISPYPDVHSDSMYQWTFTNIQPNVSVGVLMGFDPSVVPSSLTPDFSASRTISPNKIEYPGGNQTITLSVTTRKSEFSEMQSFYRGFALRISMPEDENIESSIVSVTWPNVSGSEKVPPGCSAITHSQDPHQANCIITGADSNFTYTLVVTIDIKLKDGIREVEYKPRCEVEDQLGGQNLEVNGTGMTFATESGTWRWEVPSEHKWLVQVTDGIMEKVCFLPCANLTLGYRLVIHDMPPGRNFQTWVDRGATFSSDDLPYSFATENATTCYYLSNYTRYRFMGWTGDHESASFPFNIGISNSTLIDANWAKEHKVTIRSSKDSPVKEYEGWYDENATFQYLAEVKMTRDFFYDYVLDHYTINDVVHMERDISVSVAEPLDVLVNYRSEINIMNVSMVAIPLVAVALIIIILGMRKGK